jgi:hypothetical protein
VTAGYRTLDVSDLLRGMPEVAQVLRPVKIQIDPDPENAVPGIFRASYQPVVASTSRDLMRLTDLPVWDVNGYYRGIGITWPFRPSKREMRRSYQRVGGPNDEFATYAFKRLLDPVFREHYDQRPLGEPVDDKYRWLQVKRHAAAWAAAESLRTGRLHTERDFIGQDLSEKIERVESGPKRAAAPEWDPDVDLGWHFGYYLWGSRKRDERTLRLWQELLVEAMWNRRLRVHIAVGYVGHRPDHSVREHYDRHDIIFLHESQEPTRELAEMVAESFAVSNDVAQQRPLGFTLSMDASVLDEQDQFHLFTATPGAYSTQQQYAERHSPDCSTKEPRMSVDLDFATGGLIAAERAKAEAAARKSRYDRTFLTSLLSDDGDKTYLRFLTDEPQWIETKQHGMLKTKSAPKDKPADKGWPETLGSVCRYTLMGADRHPAFSDCYACDHMTDEKGRKMFAGTRLWALAAVREPVIGTPEMVEAGQIRPEQVGNEVTYRDKTDEVDEIDKEGKATGQKIQRKQIVIVNMAMANFFSPLLTQKQFYSTVLDRDFMVVRKGAKGVQRVQYEFAAANPVYVQHPESGEAVIFDLRDPKFAATYEGHGMSMADLRKYIGERMSDEFYRRYFDTRYEVSWNDGRDDDAEGASAKAAPSQAQQAGQSLTQEPTSGVTQEQLAAMRAKLLESNPTPSAASASDTPVVITQLS